MGYLMNFHSLLGALVGDGELEDNFLVVVGIHDFAKLVGEVDAAHLGSRGLTLRVLFIIIFSGWHITL